MSKLSSDDVKHVAKLAKLNLTSEEISKYLKQLSSVIDFVGQLGEVDTHNVEPTSQTTGLENVFRNDEIKNKDVLTKEKALSGKDDTYNGYFKVGKILENK